MDLDSIKGMVVDGVAGSEAIDSSGEILDVAGADISDFQNATAVINYEHKAAEEGGTPQDILGRILYGKKIFGPKDCDTDRQREFWDKVKLPYIYFIGVLGDEAGHDGAKAAAALIRNDVANGLTPVCRWSVEGSTLEQKDHRLVRTVCRRLALTVKPCNRSVQTGILADPGAPAKFAGTQDKLDKPTQDLVDRLAGKFAAARKSGAGDDDALLYRKLGSSWEDAYDPQVPQGLLGKALDGGMGTGAPSTLSGGAALQRESLGGGKVVQVGTMNKAKAALRDWWGSGKDLRPFLKMRLPEASPEFLERFASTVDDYRLRGVGKGNMLKAEELQALAKKAAVKLQAQAPQQQDVEEHATEGDTSFDPEALDAARGKVQLPPPSKYAQLHAHQPGPLPQPTSRGRAYFDADKGILHTHLGSYPMNIPKDAQYRAILNSPAVQRPHEEAMHNWLQLHKVLKSGKLPPEVAMHAAMFSGQSSSNPVPMQEIGYSHLQDLLGQGMRPDKPGGVQSQHKKAYMRAVLPGTAHLPEYMREHWAGPGGDATRTGAGEQRGMLYPQQKWNSVETYHELHPDLVKLLQQHGVDGRTIANTLIAQKQDAKLHAGRARVAERKTGEAQPSYQEATGQSRVPGFAPKTIRYMLGMMGAGNLHVPDTHFIRHAFALPTDDQVRQETEAELGRKLEPHEQPYAPNAHLKNVMWYSPAAGHIGNAIDQYYGAHHPAVDMVREKYGKQLSSPEQALFPGFWAHWLSIAPHEARQGVDNYSSNAATNHQVYWNAVQNILKHYGLDRLGKSEVGLHDAGEAPQGVQALPLHMKTFLAQTAMEKLLGETPATLFFAQKLLPLLLAKKGRVSPEVQRAAVAKMEALGVELAAVTADLRKAEEYERFGTETYQGQKVVPGMVRLHEPHPEHGQKNFVILGATPEGYVGHFPHTPEKLERMPHEDVAAGKAALLRLPKPADSQGFTIEAQHGIPEVTRHPEQKRLLHGLRTETRQRAPAHATAGYHDNRGLSGYGEAAFWTKGPAGQPVYVKRSIDAEANTPYNEARREAAYYNLGKEYFGMGDYLTPAAAYTHPITGDDYSISEGIPDAQHWEGGKDQKATLAKLHEAGELDKLQLMNGIMGNTDRNSHNYVFSPSSRGGIKLIDHGHTLFHGTSNHVAASSYMYHHLNPNEPFQHHPTQAVHPVAQQWLLGLRPEELVRHAAANGMPPEHQLRLMDRLVAMKAALRINPGATYNDLSEAVEHQDPAWPTSAARGRMFAAGGGAGPGTPPVQKSQRSWTSSGEDIAHQVAGKDWDVPLEHELNSMPELVPIKSIEPPRQHGCSIEECGRDPGHVRALEASIKAGASVPPIVVEPRAGSTGKHKWTTWDGNHRLLAAQHMGLTHVPVLRMTPATPPSPKPGRGSGT